MIRGTTGYRPRLSTARQEVVVMTDQQAEGGRPFVGIHMKCCNIYIRAYVNAAADAFVGWCPQCARQVRIAIVADPGQGSTNRFFEAS